MKAISSKTLREKLRGLGFQQIPGAKEGHELWMDQCGRTVRPVLRKKDVHIGCLYSLGLEMENKGICRRREFLKTCFAS